MERSRIAGGGSRRPWRGLGGRQRAAIVTALAAGDIAYRVLVREQLRRALGIEVRRA